MASSLPSPVFAAIGVVPAVLEGVRRLPLRAVQLPIIAVSNALSGLDALRKEYEGLADRGERLVAKLRGEAVEAADDLEDRVSDLAGRASSSLGSAYDQAEDTVVEVAGATLRPPAAFATAVAEQVVEPAVVEPQPVEPPVVEPAVVEPSFTRHDTAASPAVQEVVEAAALGAAEPVGHDELPLADYDHMTLGSLRGRLRSLTVEELVQVRSYEKAHADRLPVVTMLDNRIAKLATDAGAAPA